MRIFVCSIIFLVLTAGSLSVQGNEKKAKKASGIDDSTVSFRRDVFPIIKKNCLPCHAEDNYNPSELSMDDFSKMAAGGKNGPLWIAGKSAESLLIKKLSETPPFGDRMPLNSKRKIKEGKAKYLTDEEVRKIASWIDDGAKED